MKKKLSLAVMLCIVITYVFGFSTTAYANYSMYVGEQWSQFFAYGIVSAQSSNPGVANVNYTQGDQTMYINALSPGSTVITVTYYVYSRDYSGGHWATDANGNPYFVPDQTSYDLLTDTDSFLVNVNGGIIPPTPQPITPANDIYKTMTLYVGDMGYVNDGFSDAYGFSSSSPSVASAFGDYNTTSIFINALSPGSTRVTGKVFTYQNQRYAQNITIDVTVRARTQTSSDTMILSTGQKLQYAQSLSTVTDLRSFNNNIATTYYDGQYIVVEGVAEGSTTISCTAKTYSGSYIDLTLRVTVKAAPTSTVFHNIEMVEGTTQRSTVKRSKSGAIESTNPSVATSTFGSDGYFTVSALKPGTAQLSATVTEPNGKSYTLVTAVTVMPKIEKPIGLTFNLKNMPSHTVGNVYTPPQVSINGVVVNSAELLWTPSDDSIIELVDKKGTFKVLKPGNVKLIAVSKDGEYSNYFTLICK